MDELRLAGYMALPHNVHLVALNNLALFEVLLVFRGYVWSFGLAMLGHNENTKKISMPCP